MKLKDMVALRIKTLRKRRKMTQEQLAEKIERTVDAVSQLERGMSLPSFETLERLSAALDVPVREFFGHEGARDDDSPRRARLLVALLDLTHQLSDDEVEVTLRVAEALWSKAPRPSPASWRA